MHGRRLTWSNEREIPTMTKIDRVLVSVDWDLEYPDYLLQALSTSVSDPTPLLLNTSAPFSLKKIPLRALLDQARGASGRGSRGMGL